MDKRELNRMLGHRARRDDILRSVVEVVGNDN